MTFEKDGIIYVANKGFAFAKKGDKILWRAMDVFTTTKPSEDAVLMLSEILQTSFDLEKLDNKKQIK